MGINVAVENFFTLGIRSYPVFSRIFAVFYLFGSSRAALMISYGINVDFDARNRYDDIADRFFCGNGKAVVIVENSSLFRAVTDLISYRDFVVRLSVFTVKRNVKSLRVAVLISERFARNRAADITRISNAISR